jgi:hypothetical protein
MLGVVMATLFKTWNFSTISGDTWSGATIGIKVNGVALDLTSASIEMQIRKTRLDTPILTLKSSVVGEITISATPTDGKFTINPVVITGEPGGYYYDVEITLQDNSVKTYLSGVVTLIGEITHA